MAQAIKTVLTYNLDGTTKDFNIPFEYLARKFVVVTLIGVDRKVLRLNQDYRFATRTTISTTLAWGPATGYEKIEIRRYTSATERLVDFTDGSILRAYDLNVAQVQTLHVAEEARDLTADTIGVNNDGNLDARGRRIVNVADAVEPGDAVSLRQLQTWNESALNSAKNAAVSENNAKDSEEKAKVSETNAKDSERASKVSEDMAHEWAQKAENSPVTANEYSAYHYSRKASASSAAAATSATRASTSEVNAKNSETNAKDSEISAKASADKAEEEASKLGNMNELATMIDHADSSVPEVAWKANNVQVHNPSTPEADSRSYVSYWKANGAHGRMEAFKNNNDGGLMINAREDRYDHDSPFFFVGDGTFNTGRLMTRLDAGKDPVAFPSYFSQSISVSFHGNTSRIYSNGDFVTEGGSSVYEKEFRAGVRSLGHVLAIIRDEGIIDVWLSPATWWGPYGNVGHRADYNLNGGVGGSVVVGMTFDGKADRRFLDGIFYKDVWKKHFGGRAGVIGTY